MERKVSMISRHLIRIKVLQTLYAFRRSENPDEGAFSKELSISLSKSYEQYLILLSILADLRRYVENRISLIQDRQIKNDAEWQRLQRFADNRVLRQLDDNATLQALLDEKKIPMVLYDNAFRKIYNDIISPETDFYEAYIQSEDTYEADKNFVRTVLMNVIAETELLFETFEDNSVFWNDDTDNVIAMVEKTIRDFSEQNPQGGAILPMFADNETRDFGFTLFHETLAKWDDIQAHIEANLKNWDLSRIAEMDIIVMQMAVTEMMVFKEIPLPVSMNEYIELAKWYSTSKSGNFVNGVLYKVSEELKNEGKIKKVGRGLIEKI